jgi:flagellar hook-associated protein 1 FlgK
MGLGQALTSAVSGMRVTQSSLSLIASNIANAETPGYVKKTATQVATAAGDVNIGVRLSTINRELDVYTQSQLRTETSGGTYASQRSDYYQRLQAIFGTPGGDDALDTVFNNFTSAVQNLATSPDSSASQYSLLTSAQNLAQHLNGMTQSIQGMRSDAESALSDAVTQANNAMQKIADLNKQIGSSSAQDTTTASLQDQRDYYIDQLSQLMNIKVVQTDNNQVNVFTGSGAQLVGDRAGVLSFDTKGTLGPSDTWTNDPNTRGVGTITLTNGAGGGLDLIASNSITSGKIGALIEMRDHILPQAQGQIDQVAAAMSTALSNKTTAGTAQTVGGQSGFDVDIGSLQSGNTINIGYTDKNGNAQQLTLVRVDDPKALPLSNSATPGANDKVIGIDFSQGMASVFAQIASALGPTGLKSSNTTGTTLRVLDDGAGGQLKVNAVSTTATETSLTGGSGALPLFLDGTNAYTGAISKTGSQSTGFAGRIAVNPALFADPSRLVVYQTSPLTASGDATRPNFMLNQLSNAVLGYAPQAGIGTASSPFSGTLTSYIGQMISQQGAAASNADSLNQGQQVVVNTLQQRFSDESSVNIDEEMANLVKLQTAYGANARVMTTIRDMLDTLLKM